MNQSLNNLGRSVTTLAMALSLSACGKVPSITDSKKTVQTLVGTSWGQPGAAGGFTISERSLRGFDGCNSFGHSPDAYFTFAPGGTIDANADWLATARACPPLKTLSSFPWMDWKTYELRNGQLIIKTGTGETHTFTASDPIP
ncbi:MAG: hypothetical protein FJ146_07355 [Deltaproteobacteria bacterium]|nr:hypothetical protein [Deltaproteobacteria bacterium]